MAPYYRYFNDIFYLWARQKTVCIYLADSVQNNRPRISQVSWRCHEVSLRIGHVPDRKATRPPIECWNRLRRVSTAGARRGPPSGSPATFPPTRRD